MNGLYITMYCNSTAVARVGAAAATPGVDKIRSIDEALRLSEKADNTTRSNLPEYYTSSETQMVRKHEVTTNTFVLILQWHVLSEHIPLFVGWYYESDAGRQM